MCRPGNSTLTNSPSRGQPQLLQAPGQSGGHRGALEAWGALTHSQALLWGRIKHGTIWSACPGWCSGCHWWRSTALSPQHPSAFQGTFLHCCRVSTALPILCSSVLFLTPQNKTCFLWELVLCDYWAEAGRSADKHKTRSGGRRWSEALRVVLWQELCYTNLAFHLHCQGQSHLKPFPSHLFDQVTQLSKQQSFILLANAKRTPPEGIWLCLTINWNIKFHVGVP